MKKLVFLLAAAFMVSLSFTSCGSDDDSSTGSIEGKWFFETLKVSVNGNVVQEGPYDENVPTCSKNYIEFLNSGVCNSAEYYLEDTTCNVDITSGSWIKEGNKLSVISDDEVQVFKVVNVSSNKLTLEVSFAEGVSEYTGTITFSKAIL